MKTPRIAVFAFGLTAFALLGTAVSAAPLASNANDQKYLTQIAQATFTDTALIQAAQRQGTPAVQQFIQTLSQDRDSSNSQLQGLAQQKSITLPTQISDADKAAVTQATQRKGAEFDKAFLEQELALNGDAASATRQELRMTTDPEIKKFATAALKTEEAHMERARTLLGLLGGSDEVGLASVPRS